MSEGVVDWLIRNTGKMIPRSRVLSGFMRMCHGTGLTFILDAVMHLRVAQTGQ